VIYLPDTGYISYKLKTHTKITFITNLYLKTILQFRADSGTATITMTVDYVNVNAPTFAKSTENVALENGTAVAGGEYLTSSTYCWYRFL